ncbi:YmfQ family protein [Salmonella enterica]|uniref:YmfQ family protein n=1 Tax=Salmonella enterica TaxID=28901 RepID=UPI003D30FBDC
MSSRYNREQYRAALTSLMPKGQAWPENDPVQQAVLTALAESCVRSDNAAVTMLKTSFPATATDFLTEWEKSLGLPDNCSISETGVGARQQAILAKLAFSGGQSRQFYTSLAKSMGYDISIAVFRQARSGLSHCGDALNGDDWPACWQVTVPGLNYIAAQCQKSYCGDPLRSWGNRRLACTLNRQTQSHTVVLFNYLQSVLLSAEKTLLSGELVYPDRDINVAGATVDILFTDRESGDFNRKRVITDQNGRFSIKMSMSGKLAIQACARFTKQSYGPLMLSSDIFYYTNIPRPDIPENRINVKSTYGEILGSSGQSVPVKSAFGSVVSGGNTLSIPVKAVCGTTMDSGANLQKPVKSIYGYLLVTEV